MQSLSDKTFYCDEKKQEHTAEQVGFPCAAWVLSYLYCSICECARKPCESKTQALKLIKLFNHNPILT